MIASFKAHCKDENEYNKYLNLFNLLYSYLSELSVVKVYVDVVRNMNLLDINLNLGHKILLSVSKSNDTLSDNNVMYSINVDDMNLYIGIMDLHELINKCKSIQKYLKNI